MSPNDDGITPAILLQHMQAMEQRLGGKIDDVRTELKGELKRVETKLESKIDVLSMQIGNIDERLDDLEVVQVPKLKKAVGMR